MLCACLARNRAAGKGGQIIICCKPLATRLAKGQMSPPSAPAAARAPLLWLLLALPSLALVLRAAQPDADPDELANWSGQLAMVLFAAALASTGVARFAGQRLLRHRRALGLAAFGTSLVHLGLYAVAMGTTEAMVAELGAPGIWTGWAALALLVPLALTSRDAAMRRLGRAWKRVQRLAWPAMGFALAHTYLVHDGQRLALLLAGVLLVVQLSRFIPGRTRP
jgi:methionine sulfoxide reductase heme-binding subunit